MKALIFNSGLGSRMGNLTEEQPKCMVKLYNGETIFERQIRILSECGIKDFIITTGPFKEQLYNIASKFPSLNFKFVENENYRSTNYIVSMYNANELLDEDVLVLHGDLVFNKGLVVKLLSNENESVCLYNEEKALPEKDFKGRFKDNKLLEVSVNIFDDDCYAFQPLYKLSKKDIDAWKQKVAEFVEDGNVKVYAENALNEILNELNIQGMSYKDDYIDEIDNETDYDRVNREIESFEYQFELRNRKYLKVMFGTKSGASDFEYKLGEVNIANNWNPEETDPKRMGGFNFSTEDKILRWLVRGDTIYDVEIPGDADIIDCINESAPHGVFRSNKIIIKNPRKVDDEYAMKLYLKSDLPEKSYFKTMAGCAVRGHINTAIRICEDRVNKDNVDLAISEFEDFCKMNRDEEFDKTKHLGEFTKIIYDIIKNIKK